jgi:hypothetical protein
VLKVSSLLTKEVKKYYICVSKYGWIIKFKITCFAIVLMRIAFGRIRADFARSIESMSQILISN